MIKAMLLLRWILHGFALLALAGPLMDLAAMSQGQPAPSLIYVGLRVLVAAWLIGLAYAIRRLARYLYERKHGVALVDEPAPIRVPPPPVDLWTKK